MDSDITTDRFGRPVSWSDTLFCLFNSLTVNVRSWSGLPTVHQFERCLLLIKLQKLSAYLTKQRSPAVRTVVHSYRILSRRESLTR